MDYKKKHLLSLNIIFIFIQFVFVNITNAQTGIGTTSPHASAKLEISSSNKGFLPPRIALTGTNDVTTIASPATGLVIYNTATSGTTPNNVIPGFYYYDASKWNQLVDQSSLNSFSGFNPNYAQSNASAVSRSAVGDIIVSQSITTSGRPVQIIATGDANPANYGAWVQLQLYRDGAAIGKKVQAESSSSNENVPYCLNFIDNPSTPGAYTYSVRIVGGSGAFGFGESDGNHITLLELGAWSAGTMPVSKGGTGNSSYTSGSVIFSDGTNLAQNNTNFFWDNSNGRLGIGTNTPTTKLDVTGSLQVSGNTTLKSSLNIGTGVGAEGGEMQLAYAQTGNTLSGTAVVVDVYQDRLRIFESGGNARGVFLDLSKAPSGVGGELMFKASGLVNTGSFVTLDNVKVGPTRTGAGGGYAGLSVGAVSTSFVADISGFFSINSVGGNTATNITYTTTASSSINGWGFTQGHQSTYILNDTTNSRVYRITLMIGASYNNNFISIERLF
jgi:hypothetical protein